MNKRWTALPSLLSIALAAPAAASADTIDLVLSKPGAEHGRTIRATGTLTPPSAQPVTIELQREGASSVIASGTTAADGTYRLTFKARLPGRLVARTPTAASAPVGFGVRPVVRLKLAGRKVPAAKLKITGRVLPAAAGPLKLRVPGAGKTVTPEPDGRFTSGLTVRKAGTLCVRAATTPGNGFTRARKSSCTRIAAPFLTVGSRGPAVRVLENRLRSLRYALRGANGYFGPDTRDALMAFQKVERIARTGTASGAVWRRLPRARTPKPVAGGDYIQISKSRQLLLEVRDGRTRRIIHTSTGLTGNTPVGRFRVYRKDPGLNSIGMYYSLYFIGGFAVHGYVSVPPYPASHGCARVPLWLARGLYDRWPIGTKVRVLR